MVLSFLKWSTRALRLDNASIKMWVMGQPNNLVPLQLPKSWFKLSDAQYGWPQDDPDPCQPERALQQPHGGHHQRSRGQQHPLQSGMEFS